MRRTSPRTIIFALLLAVLVGAVAGGAAYGFSRLQEPRFGATAVWTLRATIAVEDVDLEAFANALRSEEILTVALRSLLEREPTRADLETLRESVDVTAASDERGGSIRLHVTAPTRETADERAEALADAFTAWREAAGPGLAEAAVARLDRQIESVDRRIRSTQVLGAEAEAQASVGQLLEARRALVDRRQAAATSAEEGAPVASVEQTMAPARQVQPRTLRNVIAAAAGATLLAFALGLRRPIDSRRGAPSSPSYDTGRVLVTFPRAAAEDSRELRHAASQLHARLMATTAADRPRSFLVTSAFEGAGKTTVARHLAERFAQSGRTLLVDGNLAAPSIAAGYGVDTREAPAGIVSTTVQWLQTPNEPHRVATVAPREGITFDLVPQFRPTRPVPGTAGALFAGIQGALRRWDGYDAVVVDSPALLSMEDARLLARHVTATILVVNRRDADGRGLVEAKRVLQEAGVQAVGVVVNDLGVPGEEAVAAPRSRGRDDADARSSRGVRVREIGPADRS